MKRYEHNFGKNPQGALSTVSGYATETTNFGETAFGILNKSTIDKNNFTTPEVVSSSTATLFSVGNGTDTDNRKNIIELKADGTVFISGVGGYDGTNPGDSKDISKELQSVHDDIDNINLDIDRIDSDIDSIHVEQDSDLVYTFIVKGENRGTINIPRDQFLKDVSYNEETNILEFLFIVRNEENEEEQKVVKIDMTDLEDIYTNGDGLNLENKKFSIKIDADTQPYIDVSPNGLKIIGVNEALDKKVSWDESKKVITLPADGSISALRNNGLEGGVLVCQRTYDDGATYVTEIGTTKNNLTLNSIERPKIDFAGGASENIAYESEVKSLQDRMSTAETDIDNLEGRMDTAESDIDTIQSDLSELMGDGEGSVQDQIKTALEDYLPLSGGTMTGNITFGSEDYTGGIIISGKSDTDLVNAVGGTTTIDSIREGLATEDALNEYKTSNDEKIQSIEDKLDQEIEAGNTDKETIDNYTVNGHKISENPVLTKTDVGLNQVDNVQQIPMSMKGQAGGVAELDANGKVPSSQLNGQLAHVFGVDGVVANQAALPTEGVIVGDIYYTTENPNFYNYNGTSWDAPMAPKEDTIYNFRNSDATGDTSRTNILYRWDGATLVEISESLALGEVAGTAYEGNKGAANKAAIGTNTYTGANYISKETNLTDAVLQLDEEIKATNDNLALEHANAEATYATKTELEGYLPLTGGNMTGNVNFNHDINITFNDDEVSIIDSEGKSYPNGEGWSSDYGYIGIGIKDENKSFIVGIADFFDNSITDNTINTPKSWSEEALKNTRVEGTYSHSTTGYLSGDWEAKVCTDAIISALNTADKSYIPEYNAAITARSYSKGIIKAGQWELPSGGYANLILRYRTKIEELAKIITGNQDWKISNFWTSNSIKSSSYNAYYADIDTNSVQQTIRKDSLLYVIPVYPISDDAINLKMGIFDGYQVMNIEGISDGKNYLINSNGGVTSVYDITYNLASKTALKDYMPLYGADYSATTDEFALTFNSQTGGGSTFHMFLIQYDGRVHTAANDCYGIIIDPNSTDPYIGLYRDAYRNYSQLEITKDGINIHGKTSNDLLHASGGTVSISEIGTQLGESTLATKDELADYLTKTDASNTYQPKGNYLTTIPSEYVTDSELNAKGYQTEAQVAAKVSALVDSAPETLDTLNELAAALGDDPNFATTITNQIAGKQDKLVSGTNIKTINNQSIVGSGNIEISDKQVTVNTADRSDIYRSVLSSPGSDSSFTGNPVSLPGVRVKMTESGGSLLMINDSVQTAGESPTNDNISAIIDRGFGITAGTNDRFVITAGGHDDEGFGLIAMLDNDNDPIYVCNVDTAKMKIGHLITLLDEEGNQKFNDVTANKFIGNLQGNADTATKATQDASGNVITDTYAKKSDIVAPTVKAASGNLTLWTGTETEYNAIDTKDPNTLYFILES